MWLHTDLKQHFHTSYLWLDPQRQTYNIYNLSPIILYISNVIWCWFLHKRKFHIFDGIKIGITCVHDEWHSNDSLGVINNFNAVLIILDYKYIFKSLPSAAADHITYGYWFMCSSFRQCNKRVDLASTRNKQHYPQFPSRPQAVSLRSGSVSHLNKHGPAEDGGVFRGVKETALLNETIEAGEFYNTASSAVYS